jgi:integration host factor subunit alpha|tara:strand:- start:508 stop:780 length:273 start_codon:yes stop_codon:yes gene_type:complete
MTNKKYISKEISSSTKLSIDVSKKILESFLDIIKNNAKSKKIKLSHFGSFDFKNTPKRIGRNPKTKESYIIPSMNKLSFKASNKIKKLLN